MTRPGGVALCLVLLATGARAQAPDARADVERFRLELEQSSDTTTLMNLERRLRSGAATPGAEALRRLHRGFVRLRLAGLGDGPQYVRAAGDFSRAAALQPEWSLAWLGRGLALQAEGARQAADPLNLGKRVGFGSLEGALDAFRKASDLDSLNVEVLCLLQADAVVLRDTARMAGVVLPALRRAARAGVRDTGLLYALGRTERLVGDPRGAVAAFRAYLDNGGTRGLGLRELAWSAFSAGESADSVYYAGASADDAATVAAYREDLALIADDSTLATFDRLSGSARETYLRRFWTDRDRQSLRADGARLGEHFRRITYAEQHFGLEVNRRYHSDSDMFRSGSTRFDDRGLVYVRYGTPDQLASTSAFSLQPNQTWFYRGADRDLLLHFAANVGGDLHDYRLVPSVMAIGGVGSVNDESALPVLLRDRCTMFEAYCKLQMWGGYKQQRALHDERRAVYSSVTWAISTDGWELRFPRALGAETQGFAIGSIAGKTLLHFAWRVPVALDDSVIPPEARLRLPIRLRLTVEDAGGHSVAWVDTQVVARVDRSEHGTPEAYGRLALPITSGRWHFRAAISVGDSIGSVLPTDSVDVGDFSGQRFAVSDLVLSAQGHGAPWPRAEGDTAYFTARRAWTRTDTLTLYHEIYGLAAGDPYRARLLVRRGRRTVLTVAEAGTASGTVTRTSRTLSLAALPPGNYQLEIEVTASDGATASTARAITILR